MYTHSKRYNNERINKSLKTCNTVFEVTPVSSEK